MVKKAQEMYRELSPESGEFFDFMVEHQLFDLETKKGKRVGGYCTSLPLYHAPFIFSNFNGTQADVNVLTHEAGHAFAGFTADKFQKTPELCHSTSEINEIHSMGMELLDLSVDGELLWRQGGAVPEGAFSRCADEDPVYGLRG